MDSSTIAGLIPLILAMGFFIAGLYFAYRKEGQTAALLIVVGAVLTIAGMP